MALLTEHSLWFIFLCVFIGVCFSFLLYFRNDNVVFEKKNRMTMAILRGISITLLSFLILSPMIKMTVKQTEKPLLIVAVDNSESIISTKDSSYYHTQFQQNVNRLIHSFDKKYEVHPFLIGNDVVAYTPDDKIDFADKTTDLSAVFDKIGKLYVNQNVGAMVLLSDGIYNAGSNPYYKAQNISYPVYTVGMGDTELPVDLSVTGVTHNRQTFKGNFFPIEIAVSATKLGGKTAQLTLSEGEKELFTKTLSISGNRFFETVRLTLEATTTGIHKYKISLTELPDEITHKNNVSTFFIEVVESREKIALIYDSPHPDISTLKSALETSDKYSVAVFAADEFKGNPQEYSLIILHQLPSSIHNINNLYAQIQKSGTSVLFVIGNATNLNVLNELNTGLKIIQNKKLTNNAMPTYNDNFTLFTFSEETRQMLKKFPPLTTPFGEYHLAVSSNCFMYQRINGINTQYPLIVFNDAPQNKIGIIAGTGLWQWNIYNYLYAQNHNAYNEIINKLALYLSVKGDKSQFRVYADHVYDENRPITFTAELYNDSYELINDPEVSLNVTGEDGKEYSAQFSKQNNAYTLSLGELPIGDYSWQAKTANGTKAYTKSGTFSVKEMMVETVNLVADHALLQSIATSTNGKFFLPDEMDNVTKEIKNNDQIKPVASYTQKYSLLLNSWVYFAIIVLLLCIEWFIRKWSGSY